jgi:hypothetical protein
MNKLYLIIFLLIFYFSSSLLSQEHPWEKYGFKPKIITLSKGKYQEFHDNDTIVEIGSAVFDRKNGRIIGIVKADTSANYLIMKPSIVSRWISPDNFAEKYFSLSPYNYVANNPLSNTDPTGDTIHYNFANAQALIGFIGKILQFSSENLNGQFQFTLTNNSNEDGYNFTLGLEATKNGGDRSKLSKEGGEFLNAMEGYINSETVLKQTIVANDPEVRLIDAVNNKLDIANVHAFDRKKGGPTGASVFIHETDEQFTKAKKGYSPGEPSTFTAIVSPKKASNIAYGGHNKAHALEEKV